MSIELKPSRNWPGRTDLIYRTHPESSMSTAVALTSEDIKALVQALTEAGHIKPQVEQEEMAVYGYCVVDLEGAFVGAFPTQQAAIDFTTTHTYRIAAIVDQGGL